MKKLTAILLSVFLVAAMAACGGGTPAVSSEAPAPEAPASESAAPPAEAAEPAGDASAELRFTWWGTDARVERTTKAIDLFMAANPGISIIAEPKPSDSYWDSLNTQLAGGNAPDLLQFGGNYPDFTSFLLPLQDFIGTELMIGTPEEFDQQPLQVGTMDGNLYGVCLGTNALMLVYNKTLLETSGAPLPPDNWTWEEMAEYGRQIKPMLPDGVFPFVDNSVNQANYLSYFYRQHGEPLWTSDEQTLATEATSLAWFNLWEGMRAEGLIPDIETTAGYLETSVDNSILVPGKAAIGLLWSNQLVTYQGAMTDTLGVATLPTGAENALAIQVSQYLSINNACANPTEAARFINFFVQNEEAGAILGTDRGIPSSPTVRAGAEAGADDIDKLLFAYLNRVAPISIPQDPNLPNDQEFVDNLRQIGQNISFGNATTEAGAAELYQLIQRLMVK